MRIQGVSGAYEVYNTSPVEKVNKVAKTGQTKDIANISTEAKDFQTILKAAMQVPDIREEKVNDLKTKIEAGEYNISTDDVVDKMFEKIEVKKA